MVKNRKITTDTVLDPYAAATGWLPWSYFYAVGERDEVGIFWSAVYGGAAVGAFIGHTLGAGGYAAWGSHSAHFMVKRFAPLGLILTSAQLQHHIGEEMDAEHAVAMNFAATGGFTSAMPIVTSQDTSDPMGGLDLSWTNIKSMFGW